MRRLLIVFLSLLFLVGCVNEMPSNDLDLSGQASRSIRTVPSTYSAINPQYQDLQPSMQRSVLVIVDPSLYKGIETSLKQFKHDLSLDDYSATIVVKSFSTPKDLRDFLKSKYDTLNLEGAILIGKLPLAYRFIEGNGVSTFNRSAVTFTYYQDLDGVFEKNNSDFPEAFSIHSGETKSEIWVSVIPYYNTVRASQVAINNYFTKNHKFRTRKYNPELTFIQINELSQIGTSEGYETLMLDVASGFFSWVKYTKWSNFEFFVDNEAGQPGVDEGYTKLSSEEFLVASLTSHGSSNNAGKITKDWLKENLILSTLFFVGGCSAGNLEYSTPPILEEMLYSKNSNALVLQGTTSVSGGLGYSVKGFYGSQILTGLALKKSIGSSLIEHLNEPLVSPWSKSEPLHHDLVILMGDGSLKFPLALK